jgi:hypothetical protein
MNMFIERKNTDCHSMPGNEVQQKKQQGLKSEEDGERYEKRKVGGGNP